MTKRIVHIRNQQIGIEIQERIAVLLESYLPDYFITSNGTYGADLIISDKNGFKLEVEVKTAKELFWDKIKDKKKCQIKRYLRRGVFNILPEQLDHELFVFVIRFVEIFDIKTIWNRDIEVWYALGKDVKEYLKTQLLKCRNYKVCIEELPLMQVKLDFFEIFNEIKKLKEV